MGPARLAQQAGGCGWRRASRVRGGPRGRDASGRSPFGPGIHDSRRGVPGGGGSRSCGRPRTAGSRSGRLAPPPGSGSGLLVSLAGLAWFAADWVGWEGGPPLARSVAMAAAPFFLAFVVHLVMASPGGRLRSRRQRLAAGAVYAAAAIVSVGSALVRDPFLDPYCWSNCTDNVFLISAQPAVARILDRIWILVSLTVGLLLAALATRYLISATPTARRTMSPILVPAVLLGLAIAAHALALLRQPLESPRDVVFSTLFQVQAWAAAMLAVGARPGRRTLVASPGHPRSARVGPG